MRPIKIDDRATRFVGRANAALEDLPLAAEIWEASIGSTADEMRLHSFAVALDNAIRKVEGDFDAWFGLDPAQVQLMAQSAPIHLSWVVSAHPSGRVREAFVHTAKDLETDQFLPHLANRAIDFVPAIRQVAGPIVIEKLGEILGERSGPGEHGVLPTAAHITVTKLLSPRTAVVNPELIHACIAVAKTAAITRPKSLSGTKLDRMLERCRQTLATVPDAQSSEAIEALVEYFESTV